MPRRKYAMSVRNTWKTRTILSGAMIGAFAGIMAAYLLTRRAEREGRETALTPGEGMKLGVLVVGLLRAISSLGNEK